MNEQTLSGRGSLLAAWVIGPYLAIQTVTLALVAVLTWLSSDWESLLTWLPLPAATSGSFLSGLPGTKFLRFQREVLAACSAGLGGAVFMIREFYVSFAYGNKKDRLIEFLETDEIPRYLLLPLSSFILGPVGLALLQAGAIVFSGFSARHDVPLFTIIAVGFLLGFGYHDTLIALRNMSRKLLSSEEASLNNDGSSTGQGTTINSRGETHKR